MNRIVETPDGSYQEGLLVTSIPIDAGQAETLAQAIVQATEHKIFLDSVDCLEDLEILVIRLVNGKYVFGKKVNLGPKPRFEIRDCFDGLA